MVKLIMMDNTLVYQTSGSITAHFFHIRMYLRNNILPSSKADFSFASSSTIRIVFSDVCVYSCIVVQMPIEINRWNPVNHAEMIHSNSK